MGIPFPRPAALAVRLEAPIEKWVNCIPVLTGQLNQGLIAHGEHLTSRCQGWTDDMVRQQGWAPEVA